MLVQSVLYSSPTEGRNYEHKEGVREEVGYWGAVHLKVTQRGKYGCVSFLNKSAIFVSLQNDKNYSRCLPMPIFWRFYCEFSININDSNFHNEWINDFLKSINCILIYYIYNYICIVNNPSSTAPTLTFALQVYNLEFPLNWSNLFNQI